MDAQLPHMLRSDAKDNRDRIVAAARGLFSEHGLGVGMREVARRAEVGPATLYRRFPTKQTLIEEAFSVELNSCRKIVEDGCADSDAWRGFSDVVRGLTSLNVRNRGLVDAFMSADPDVRVFSQHRQELLEMLARLALAAQLQGALRRDFRVDDLVLILLAGRGLTSTPSATEEEAAQRFAELALDAFHSDSTRRRTPPAAASITRR